MKKCRIISLCFGVLFLLTDCGTELPIRPTLTEQQRGQLAAELAGVRVELADRAERDDNPPSVMTSQGFVAYRRNKDRVIELRAREAYLTSLLAQDCMVESCEHRASLEAARQELIIRERLIPTPKSPLTKEGYREHTKNLDRIATLKGTIARLESILGAGDISAERTEPLDLGRGVKMQYVGIPAGAFWMGCSVGDAACNTSEKPRHQIRITMAFQMGQYEVTQAQWEAVMGENRSSYHGQTRPVEQVSWNDTQEFLEKLNKRNDGYRYRLPTEAEWEYAARAGSTEEFPAALDAIAWYDRNSGSQTHNVGEKQPNAWGLHDMQGNVWEWCQDWYDPRYYANSPSTDPKGPPTGQYRVLRGGSWSSPGAWFVRLSNRGSIEPAERSFSYGFRCVRERH